MPGLGKETQNEVKKSSATRELQKKKPKLQPNKVAATSLKRKTHFPNKSRKPHSSKRDKTIAESLPNKANSLPKCSLSCQKDKSQITTLKESGQDHKDAAKRKRKRRKKRNDNLEELELDEASRLQRRTRYLLIKMKLEQNLIDAYSTEGWKGQSREKIKPEKELQRARKQILNCKLGIRDAIHHLDLLSSKGRINDSAIAPDGSVHHEYIICAKCKLREAFPDNDIILCDGTCNRAFHQKCLDPPLSTENRDEGWFCKFCKSKMDILEATNAHLGTHFALDSDWQDIFKEEAVNPDGGDSLVCLDHEWPSDESDDDDYDPENIETSCNRSTAATSDDDYSSFTSLASLEDEVLFLTGNIEPFEGGGSAAELISDETTDCEVLCSRRQRPSVDYIKLNDEMFGKSDEQFSEDEDWGPSAWRQRRRGNGCDAASAACHCDNERNSADAEEKERESTDGKTKRPFFRIPVDAVEQLRIVFAENELPSRAVREDLAKRLCLEYDKVNKWFKNARYIALKARKADEEKPRQAENDEDPKAKKSKRFDEKLNTSLLTSTSKAKQNEREETLCEPAKKRAAFVDFDDDVSLKFLREKAKKEKKKCKSTHRRTVKAEMDMEKLCRLQDRIHKLQKVLVGLPNKSAAAIDEPTVIFVPVAELKVKN